MRSLTGTDEGVEDEVVLLDPGMVGHDEGKAGFHTGVPYEVAVLDGVRADQFALAVCYLVMYGEINIFTITALAKVEINLAFLYLCNGKALIHKEVYN